jgi:hypothetical protein
MQTGAEWISGPSWGKMAETTGDAAGEALDTKSERQ